MKLRNNIKLLFLLLISGVCGYVLNDFTDKSKLKEIPEVTLDLAKADSIVKLNTIPVNNEEEFKIQVTERIVAVVHKPESSKVKQASMFFIRDLFSAVEPKYLMSYYNDLLSDVHIRSPMTTIVNHMAVALHKAGYLAYINVFINNAHTNNTIWEYILILAAGNNSP